MSGTDISNYGGFGTQDPNAQAISSTSNVQGTQSSSGSPLSASSIQKSELEALMTMLMAGFPTLEPPSTIATNFRDLGVSGVSGASAMTSINMQIEQTKNDIINSMWDAFNKTVQEIAQRNREEAIKKETQDADRGGPKSSAEYFAYLMSLSSTQRADEINKNDTSSLSVQFSNAFNQWMVTPVQGGNTTTIDPVSGTSNGYPSAAFIAGSLLAGSDIVRGAIGEASPALGYQLSVNPVSDALFAAGPTSALPADYQAAAALIAALLNNGAVFKATNDTIEQAAGKGQPPQDLNFAMNYAKNVMAIVTHHLEGEEQATPEQAGQNRMVRLMLSAMALNLVYRAAYGGMNGQEFASVLAGNTGDIPDQIKPLIDQLASFVNAFLPTNKNSRTSTIARLMEYVDSKDSVDSMLATTRMFSALLGTDDIDGKRMNSGLT